MNTDQERVNSITERVIGWAFEVSNVLGCGFLERPYENSLAHLLRKAGLRVEQQHPIQIWFDGIIVGDYIADLIVEGTVMVELKAVKALDDIHAAQCLNYLNATGFPVCLLPNFGRPKVEIKRFANPHQVRSPV